MASPTGVQARPTSRGRRAVRSRVSSQERGASAAALCSRRNLSAQATTGRQKNWSISTIVTAMVTSAGPSAPRSCLATAVAT